MTQTPNLGEIAALIERDLPGWQWLVRNTRGEPQPAPYFANCTSPDFEQFFDPITGAQGYTGKVCPSFGQTAEEALSRAFNTAMEKA